MTITTKMRDVLIAHIDGPLPATAEDLYPKTSRKACIDRGWIGIETSALLDEDDPAAETVLTDDGRAVLTAALGDWADAMVRARFLGPAVAIALQAAE